jgi:hypothetical protein
VFPTQVHSQFKKADRAAKGCHGESLNFDDEGELLN